LSESRKLAAIFAADVVGFSRLAGADEDRILARLRALRSDLIDPTIAVHNGRVVKRTGDGVLAEFRSVVDAVRCAIEVQNSMVERNAGVPESRRIVFRIGIHIGDVVEESDGDLMGDGVNIAARLEGVAKPGAICLSEDAYRQVRARLDLKVSDLGMTPLKNIVEPMRIYSLEVGAPAEQRPASSPPAEAAKPAPIKRGWGAAPLAAGVATLLMLAAAGAWITIGGRGSSPAEPTHLSIVVLPFANLSGDPSQDYFADGVSENLTDGLSRIRDSFVIARNTAFTYKGESVEPKQVGKDLGVRYVLQGSVQRDQGRVRINARITEVESNAQVWADRFDESFGDLAKLEGRIVARIAGALY
jgi:adenylate cyclase